MSARLTDGVAQQIMGEIHGLLVKIDEQQARVEALAKIVTAAADSINRSRTILHRQNESFLIDRVKEITGAVSEIKSLQEPIQDAAKQQVAPLVQQLQEQVGRLADKETYVMKFMQKTNLLQEKTEATQRKISLNTTVAWFMAFTCISVSFFAGFLFR